ncbi:recombinase family protein [Bradyrhizobium sp. CCBAU 45389]|uniref:recombinase family protein n=1 Tax=Bradyrhizobium sp. CCBAU 45389 TaxID=858429 RepID=UPI00230563B3|nr:recombinase family protein [Bradyrhizobium sp. CCBAU 45389]
MRPAVSYIRVSKPKQGRSGLGLEAQQAAIKAFCAQHGYSIEAEYREVETGKGADALERRPELAAAMKFVRKLGKGGKTGAAPIIIAKLDRLSRDVHSQYRLRYARSIGCRPHNLWSRWPRFHSPRSCHCSIHPHSGRTRAKRRQRVRSR